MKDSQETPITIIKSVWGSAVGMVLIAGIFTSGESTGKYIAMSVPPIAAAATTAIVLNHAKENERKQNQSIEKLQLMESRLATLETIVTTDQADEVKQLRYRE